MRVLDLSAHLMARPMNEATEFLLGTLHGAGEKFACNIINLEPMNSNVVFLDAFKVNA